MPFLNARLKAALPVWAAAALSAAGQTLGTGQGGISLSDRNTVVHAPPPVSVGQELEMAGLPMEPGPPQFYLTFGTSGRYGPYALADGTRVGSKQVSYTLRVSGAGSGFTLTPSGNTNTVYGPFPATNRAAVTLGNAVFTVVRIPPELRVTVNHPGKINQMPLVGVAPYDAAVLKELYGLRAKYAGLANRVDYETADVEIADAPRIHSRVTGNTFSPVIKKSARDIQNTLKGAERSAVTFLETLFRQAFHIRPQAITDGYTFHFRMPPGDYLLCVLQKVKDPGAQGQGFAGSATAVWWTAFQFDGERPLSATLTPDNAITWREIFTPGEK
ncbi:MAG: hypothetical protein PHV28_05855 [Kiritimatiellae bacterium]|nr:hypothetical protein [Kiritimatiellia bacterium]